MFFNTCTLLLTVLLLNLHRNKSKLYKNVLTGFNSEVAVVVVYPNIENGVSLLNIWGLFQQWHIRPKQRNENQLLAITKSATM